MNRFSRARWTLVRKGRNRYREFRSYLRSITPFGLRHSLSNLFSRKQYQERIVTAFDFPAPRDYDVVCFPIIDWDVRFQRPQQLLTQFARHGHRVFYLHTTFHQAGRSPLVRNVLQNIYRVRLPGPDELNFLYRNGMNSELTGFWIEALDQLRKTAEIRDALCLVDFPNWTRLALPLRKWDWRIVYDCMDEHSGFSGSRADVSDLESELVSESDLVVATSRLLYEKAIGRARRALFLPNAADFDHFSSPGSVRPLKSLTGPVIGYYGAIAEWFDVKMVETAAELREDWQFVLIGDTRGADIDRLERLGNVHFLGELPYGDLPAYLHQFDVASIPFLITPLTAATNPVKFYEYMSAGKPVVSSPLPELERYRDFYYPARTGPEFVAQAEAALKEDSEEKKNDRIELARLNTWSHRFSQLRDAIKDL